MVLIMKVIWRIFATLTLLKTKGLLNDVLSDESRIPAATPFVCRTATFVGIIAMKDLWN